jgi:peptidyl-prolyl cis-trans isomerase SurA
MKNTAVKTRHAGSRPGRPWIVLVLLSCWAWPAGTFAEPELVDRIVAVVNDEVISLYDLEQAMKPYRQQIEALGYGSDQERRMLFKLREDLLNQLVDEKLTDQEVKKYKISVSDEEVDRFIENLKKSNFYTDEQFQAALAQEGMTLDEYRERVRERMLRTQLLNRQVKSKIVITEEDIRSYYEAHKEQYAGEKKFHLKHIVIRVPAMADSARRAAVRRQMAEILERLRAGESFAALADRYSDPEVTLAGGELGVFAFGSLAPRIQEAVRELSPGDLTPVIESEQGYQIFLVERIEDTPTRSFEEAAPEIEEKLVEEVVDTYFAEWLENLRARSHVRIIM